MTLMEPPANRQFGSGPYDEQLGAYQASRYAVTRGIAETAPEESTFA